MSDNSSERGDSSDSKPRRRRRSKARRPGAATPVVNVSQCKYEVVRWAARELGWEVSEAEDDPNWTLWWSDLAVSTERVLRMRPDQRINHFPGMTGISRKANLARRLSRMCAVLPREYSFFPQTWTLPAEFAQFKQQFGPTGRGRRTYIVKPDASCQGRGIFLTRTWENVDPNEPQVAQRYMTKPLLIEGFKFDLRIYILITSCNPLRVFMFHDGLVRMATVPYKAPARRNLGTATMHLTNYAVNRGAAAFVANDDEANDGTGSKRSLRWLLSWVSESGGDAERLWHDIGHVCVKTVMSVLPELQHTYRSCSKPGAASSLCFDLLGFDIILDRKLRPYVLEVNLSPSFSLSSPLDKVIKRAVIGDAMRLVAVSGADTRRAAAASAAAAQARLLGTSAQDVAALQSKELQRSEARRRKHEARHCGGYRPVYPPPAGAPYSVESYGEIMAVAALIFENMTGGAGGASAKAAAAAAAAALEASRAAGGASRALGGAATQGGDDDDDDDDEEDEEEDDNEDEEGDADDVGGRGHGSGGGGGGGGAFGRRASSAVDRDEAAEREADSALETDIQRLPGWGRAATAAATAQTSPPAAPEAASLPTASPTQPRSRAMQGAARRSHPRDTSGAAPAGASSRPRAGDRPHAGTPAARQQQARERTHRSAPASSDDSDAAAERLHASSRPARTHNPPTTPVDTAPYARSDPALLASLPATLGSASPRAVGPSDPLSARGAVHATRVRSARTVADSRAAHQATHEQGAACSSQPAASPAGGGEAEVNASRPAVPLHAAAAGRRPPKPRPSWLAPTKAALRRADARRLSEVPPSAGVQLADSEALATPVIAHASAPVVVPPTAVAAGSTQALRWISLSLTQRANSWRAGKEQGSGVVEGGPAAMVVGGRPLAITAARAQPAAPPPAWQDVGTAHHVMPPR